MIHLIFRIITITAAIPSSIDLGILLAEGYLCEGSLSWSSRINQTELRVYASWGQEIFCRHRFPSPTSFVEGIREIMDRAQSNTAHIIGGNANLACARRGFRKILYTVSCSRSFWTWLVDVAEDTSSRYITPNNLWIKLRERGVKTVGTFHICKARSKRQFDIASTWYSLEGAICKKELLPRLLDQIENKYQMKVFSPVLFEIFSEVICCTITM